MAVRTGWEDRYCLSYQKTSFATNGTWTATDKGIGAIDASAKCGLMLSNHPNIDGGKSVDFAQKTTGLAQNKYSSTNSEEYVDGKRTPKVALEMGINPKRLGVFLWLLFQGGSSQGVTTPPATQKNFVVPVAGSSQTEVWAAVGRAIGSGTGADGHAIYGCVAQQVTLSGAAGERCKMAVDLLGRAIATNVNHTASVFTVESAATDAELLYWDFTTMSLGGTTVTTGLESWSLTMNNNIAAKNYAQQAVSNFTMGRFTTSGSIKLAMSTTTAGDNAQIDAFVAGTQKILILSKGTTGTDGYINISANCLYTGATVDPAEELMLDLPFDCAYDGTNQSIAIDVCDNINRTIT